MNGGIQGKIHTLQVPPSRERHRFAAAKNIGEGFPQSEKRGSPAYRASGTILARPGGLRSRASGGVFCREGRPHDAYSVRRDLERPQTVAPT